MKRSTLFNTIFLITIFLCFFSSIVFSGEGIINDKGDTHPWDLDDIVADSFVNTSESLLKTPDSNDGGKITTWLSLSMSSNFIMWLYQKEIMIEQEKQFKVRRNSLRINSRGKLSESF